MKKEDIEKRLIVVLFFILVLSIMYSKTKIKSVSSPVIVEETSFFDIEMLKAKISDMADKKILYDETLVARDPLMKPKEVALFEKKIETQELESEKPIEPGLVEEEIVFPAQEDFVLEGIIWSEKKSSAIISGEVVVEGDEVNGAKILHIFRDKVILVKDGYKIELKR